MSAALSLRKKRKKKLLVHSSSYIVSLFALAFVFYCEVLCEGSFGEVVYK